MGYKSRWQTKGLEQQPITRPAYAVVTRHPDGDIIDLNRIEPWTDDGRKDLTRQINRPAGERVARVLVTVVAT